MQALHQLLEAAAVGDLASLALVDAKHHGQGFHAAELRAHDPPGIDRPRPLVHPFAPRTYPIVHVAAGRQPGMIDEVEDAVADPNHLQIARP